MKHGQARGRGPPGQRAAPAPAPLATAAAPANSNAGAHSAQAPMPHATVGNRTMAAWLGTAADRVPQWQRSLGLGPQPVPLRADAASGAEARRLGASAWFNAGEVGLAPELPASARAATVAHELAHAAQHRGGTAATVWPVRTEARAELQADQAAEALLAGTRPQLGAFRSTRPLLKGGAAAGAPTSYNLAVRQVRALGNEEGLLAALVRLHLLNLYPGAKKSDVEECLKYVTDASQGDGKSRVFSVGRIEAALARADKAHASTINVTVSPQAHTHIAAWLKRDRQVSAPGQQNGKVGDNFGDADGSGSGAGAGKGKGAGTGAGSGAGTGTGATNSSGVADGDQPAGVRIGIPEGAGQKVEAKALDEAMAKVNAGQAPANEEARSRTTTEADGRQHIWPELLPEPEDKSDEDKRKAILAVMKEIVGEAEAPPADAPSDVPARLSIDEAKFLGRISGFDAAKRAAIIARLKGGGGLKGNAGLSLADTLDTAIANVELQANAEALGVEFNKGPPSDDPARKPIENRPVHGVIEGDSGELSPGERAVWKFRVDDDRDAFRVPHIYIAWAAYRKADNGTLVEVSSEKTHHIPVRDQGILNDSEFDFTVRETGRYVVKAIVQHNFFRPGYFERNFFVQEEFEQGTRQFGEQNTNLVATSTDWDATLFEHGSQFDYRLGRRRTGTLDDKARATTNGELVESLIRQKEEMRARITALAEADPKKSEALLEALSDREEEIDGQIARIEAEGGQHPLVARGQFSSRVRGVQDASMQLACSLSEVKPPGGGSATWFRLTLHDATPRADRKVTHFSATADSVEAAERDLFLQLAEAYPFGTVTVLFQGYDHHKHQPTRNFVQFQKKTDTTAKDIKHVVFDEVVDTAINVVGTVLSLFPPTTAIGITILVAYNTSKAISENLDDAETGNFETKKGGIALADLVLNLLPLAPKVVKVGKFTYWAIRAGSMGGSVVLMTAVGLEQVRQLRAAHVDVLTRKLALYDKLKRENPADELIAMGILLTDIKGLKEETASATKDVFTQMAAQAVFMHAVSTGVDMGYKGLEPKGAGMAKMMAEVDNRRQVVGGMEDAGLFKHKSGEAPRYDYAQGKIVGDGDTITSTQAKGLSREAIADSHLKSAKVPDAERVKVGALVAEAGVEVRPGTRTQVVPAGKGGKGGKAAVLEVAPGATAADVRAALQGVKPQRLTPKKAAKLIPADQVLGAQGELARHVNARLSPKAQAKLGTVRVELVPEGTFGPGKTRARVVQVEGQTVVRFEGGPPRPGMLAEELMHLEQLADPKMSKHVKTLQGVQGEAWHGASDTKRLQAHEARIQLEIDGQKRAIDHLMNGPIPADPEAHLKLTADVDAAFQNLEQLRHNLGEVMSLKDQAKRGMLHERPAILDERPVLTNRQTTNKTPLPAGWTKLDENKFVKLYQETYPNSTLTEAELRLRYKNGKRLNPESGYLHDRTLLDNPVPDIRANKIDEKSFDLADLKLSKAERERVQGLLDARDKARRARDKANAEGKTDKAGEHAYAVNEATRQLGEEHARAYMRTNYPEYQQVYPKDPTKPSRAGDFDQVWVRYGKTPAGKRVAVEVIIVEAKGGTSPLGARKEGGLIVQQGTEAYMQSIIKSMEKGTPEMQRVANMISTLDPSQIQYQLVRAPVTMTPGAKPRSQILAIEVANFDLTPQQPKKN
jgi:hypothetical protein